MTSVASTRAKLVLCILFVPAFFSKDWGIESLQSGCLAVGKDVSPFSSFHILEECNSFVLEKVSVLYVHGYNLQEGLVEERSRVQ